MSTTTRCATRAGWRAAAIGALLGALVLPCAAQYKVVGPDGTVTYTDRPPANTGARVSAVGKDPGNGSATPDALPYQLRQTALRFPVTLYSAANCPPCDVGRQLLVQRGVPFTEKLIVSEEDAAAMERALGSRAVPSLTIGTQALRGLAQEDWTAYLDAAGYPRESKLPKTWQAPASAPLVARAASAPASAPAAARPARPAAPPAPAPAVPVPSAPGGIRF